ncbi:hypothetical protein GPECTOR_10g794 [Gonium pectorale]|uniref:Uncharacterized protein n=1 Tax=Gonium pectorale TaxID=33097 RepID=A0A150GQR0_GONPE|nr:hypothetical protein GPECTOR_10g794 [Gonium pectorale]|eukprot:KXZ52165.1 hypothetical protein GPECTOR_10g794 [Gonium pectorale]
MRSAAAAPSRRRLLSASTALGREALAPGRVLQVHVIGVERVRVAAVPRSSAPERSADPAISTTVIADFTDRKCRRALAVELVERVDPRPSNEKLSPSLSDPFPRYRDEPSNVRKNAAKERELDCKADLDAEGFIDLAPWDNERGPGDSGNGGGGKGSSGGVDVLLEDALRRMMRQPRGQRAYVRQVTLAGQQDGVTVSGIIDFLLLLWDRLGAPRLRVVECKDSSAQKTSHVVQAALYALMLRELLRRRGGSGCQHSGGGVDGGAEGLSKIASSGSSGSITIIGSSGSGSGGEQGAGAGGTDDASPGPGEWSLSELAGGEAVEAVVVRDSEDGRPEHPLRVPLLDLEKLYDEVHIQLGQVGQLQLDAMDATHAQHGSTEAVLSLVRRQPYDFSAKCASCMRRAHCFADSIARSALELLGLDATATERLRAAGFCTVRDVAGMVLPGEEARAAPPDQRVQSLAASGFRFDLRALRTKARVMCVGLPEGAYDKFRRSIQPLPARGPSTLPAWCPTDKVPPEGPLVRIFLTGHYDGVHKRISSLAAHVTRSGEDLGTWEPGMQPPGLPSDWTQVPRDERYGRNVLEINAQPYWPGRAHHDANRLLDRSFLEGFFGQLTEAVRQVAAMAADKYAATGVPAASRDGAVPLLSVADGGSGSRASSPLPSREPRALNRREDAGGVRDEQGSGPTSLTARLHIYVHSSPFLQQLVNVMEWSGGLSGEAPLLESVLTLLGLRQGPLGEQHMVSCLDEEMDRQVVVGGLGTNMWTLGGHTWLSPRAVGDSQRPDWAAPSTVKFRAPKVKLYGTEVDLARKFGLVKTASVEYDAASRRLQADAGKQGIRRRSDGRRIFTEVDMPGNSLDPEHFVLFLEDQAKRKRAELGNRWGRWPPQPLPERLEMHLPELLRLEPLLLRFLTERLACAAPWELPKPPLDLDALLPAAAPEQGVAPSALKPLVEVLRDWHAIDFQQQLREKRMRLMQATPLDRYRSHKCALIRNLRCLADDSLECADPWVHEQLRRLEAIQGGSGALRKSFLKSVYVCEEDAEALSNRLAAEWGNWRREPLACKQGDFVRVHARDPDPTKHQTLSQLATSQGFTATVIAVEATSRRRRTAGAPALGAEPGRRVLLQVIRTGNAPGQFVLASRPFTAAAATLDESISDYVKNAVDARLGSAAGSHGPWMETLLRGGGLGGRHKGAAAYGGTTGSDAELERRVERSLAAVAGELVASGLLREEQAEGALAGLDMRCQLVQGPPGTGKTQLLAAAVLLRLMRSAAVRPPLPESQLLSVAYALPSSASVGAAKGGETALGRIALVVTSTNAAADVALERLASMGPDVRDAAYRSGYPQEHPLPRISFVRLTTTPKLANAQQTLTELRRNGGMVVVGCTVSAALKLAGYLQADICSADPWVTCPLALLALDEASMGTSADMVALLSLFQVDAETETRPDISRQPALVGSAYGLLAELLGPLRSTLSVSNRFGEVTALLLSEAVYKHDQLQLLGRRRAAKAAGAGAPAADEATGAVSSDESEIALTAAWHEAEEADAASPALLEPLEVVTSRVWSEPDELFLLLHDENASTEGNPLEVQLLREVLAAAPQGSLSADSVGVVTIRRRVSHQRSLLSDTLSGLLPAGNVDVDVVERFQGGERRTILASACTSSAAAISRQIDFYLQPERLNVMMSRHMERLVLTVSSHVLDFTPPSAEQLADMALYKEMRRLVRRKLGSCTVQHPQHPGRAHRVTLYGVDPARVQQLREAARARVEERKRAAD